LLIQKGSSVLIFLAHYIKEFSENSQMLTYKGGQPIAKGPIALGVDLMESLCLSKMQIEQNPL
jgi:hypothetical protein